VVGVVLNVGEMMIAACLAMPSWPWPSNSITAATGNFPLILMRLQLSADGVGGGEEDIMDVRK
jgi:hypothetical protein